MGKLYKDMTPEQLVLAKARQNRWKEKNREKILASKKKHYLENKHKYLTIERDRQYKKRYGISLQDYDRMFAEQKGLCKICGADKAGNTGQHFAVDHCHETLKVRGLLCIKCNARLGWYERLKDSVAKYLE